MTSGPQPFVFISIPRCASRSIHALLGLSGPKDFSDPAERGLMDNHAPWDMVRRRYGTEEFSRRFKFCFVRNPWDRCVSWHCYHSDRPPYNRLSFRDWIKAGMPHHWNIQNGTIYQDQRTPLQQHPFVTDASGALMVDFVGRIERFSEDVAAVGKELELTLPPGMPRINTSATRLSSDYRKYYDDQTAGLVETMLQRDILLFGYNY